MRQFAYPDRSPWGLPDVHLLRRRWTPRTLLTQHPKYLPPSQASVAHVCRVPSGYTRHLELASLGVRRVSAAGVRGVGSARRRAGLGARLAAAGLRGTGRRWG